MIPKLLKFMEVNTGEIIGALESEIDKLPKVSGNVLTTCTRQGDCSRSSSMQRRKPRRCKDEYISVEHLYLALLDEQQHAVSCDFQEIRHRLRNKFLDALQQSAAATRE